VKNRKCELARVDFVEKGLKKGWVFNFFSFQQGFETDLTTV